MLVLALHAFVSEFSPNLALTQQTHKTTQTNSYGAYGSKQFPSFDPADLALLNRGFVLAICHARGGGELGAAWHRAARGRSKPRTFADAAACAGQLAALQFTSPRWTALWGRSAGGLAVAGALNLAAASAAAGALPSGNGGVNGTSSNGGSGGQVQWPLCGAAVLDVPFVDPLNTMLDPTLLLTVKERPEWGDPLNDAVCVRCCLILCACVWVCSYYPPPCLRKQTTPPPPNTHTTSGRVRRDRRLLALPKPRPVGLQWQEQ